MGDVENYVVVWPALSASETAQITRATEQFVSLSTSCCGKKNAEYIDSKRAQCKFERKTFDDEFLQGGHFPELMLQTSSSFCHPIMNDNRGFEDWRGYL